jgi:kumamolisin
MLVDRVALPGSLRQQIPNSEPLGVANPDALISVTVMLRPRNPLPPPGAQRVTREAFAAQYGADPADLEPIEQFAGDNDLTLGQVDLTRRSVVLAGTVANMCEAFGTELRLYRSPDGIFRARIGSLFVPSNIAQIVTGVFGLDERPQARTRFRRMLSRGAPQAAGDTSYSPVAVAKLYNYPVTGSGAGQTVAIIELGGGYRTADLKAYFVTELGMKTVPTVTAVSVDGAQNRPVGDPNSADGEVLLDIEVVGAIAPKARIAVYFAPNTDQGFLDAITTAVHDTVRKPSVISISWGSAESAWSAQSLTNFDQAFQAAGLLGVTVCTASGDSGSTDGVTDGQSHVDFPASSPNVLACGGTRLESTSGKVTKEVVWNEGGGASGGGVSEIFPLPSYQANAKVPVSVNPSRFKGRGVPDIAGDADPATGYRIHVDGRDAVFGGTSAVAPLWAALIALINEQNGKAVGFVNPALYTAGVTGKALNDITSGANGAFTAGLGWDPCTGLGSPNGQAVLKALTAAAPTKKAPKQA